MLQRNNSETEGGKDSEGLSKREQMKLAQMIKLIDSKDSKDVYQSLTRSLPKKTTNAKAAQLSNKKNQVKENSSK